MSGQWLTPLLLVAAVHQASGYRSYKDMTAFSLFASQDLLALTVIAVKAGTLKPAVAEDENSPTRGCKTLKIYSIP